MAIKYGEGNATDSELAAAADAAYDATADAYASKQSQQATAEICRKYIPLELILAAIKSQEKI